VSQVICAQFLRAVVPHCKKSAEHLPLLETYDACKSSHMLTMLSMHPSPTSASMLVDAPLPRGSDATLASGVHCPRVPEQFVTQSSLSLAAPSRRYVRWDEQSAPFSKPDIHFRSLRSQLSDFHEVSRAGPKGQPRTTCSPSCFSLLGLAPSPAPSHVGIVVVAHITLSKRTVESSIRSATHGRACQSTRKG
jgi:hypothetical protein